MPKYNEGRPKTYLVSARNILALPVRHIRCRSVPADHLCIQFRLCNPPPSVGKVRSLSGK
jgi:hypothetical protein